MGLARSIGEAAGEPDWVIEIREDAERYIDKAPFPIELTPLDLSKFSPVGEGDVRIPEIKSLEELPDEIRDLLEKMGIPRREWSRVLGLVQVNEQSAAGVAALQYFQKIGVESYPIREALQKVDDIREYAFKLMPYRENAFVAYHTAYWQGGIFVRVKKGVKVQQPLHTYFLITRGAHAQADHALIVLDEGSEATLIEGCTAPLLTRFSLHIGATEIFVKKGAKARLIVLQNWPDYVHTRPYTRVLVEDGADVEVVVAILGAGKTTGRYEEIFLKGRSSKATIHSISFPRSSSRLEDVIKVYLEAPNTRAMINTRGVVKDSADSNSYITVESRERHGETFAHVECSGLILNGGAHHATYPIMLSSSNHAHLEHEAYVGRVSQEAIEYMKSRGFSDEEALSLMLRGYIEPVAAHIPFEFSMEIRRMARILAERGAA